jgi:hypothetical protein
MIVTDPALFTVAGEKLAVKVETGGDLMLNKSVPVLTVPASMADGVEGKLSGTSDLPKGGVVSCVRTWHLTMPNTSDSPLRSVAVQLWL